MIPHLRDLNFERTKVFPAAGASNSTDAWDLRANQDGIDTRLFVVEVKVPALPNNNDPTKTTTLTLQDSADGTTFAVVDPLIQVQITGVATTGSAARTVYLYLPPRVRRYVRFNQAVPTAGGDHTAQSVTYDFLFH